MTHPDLLRAVPESYIRFLKNSLRDEFDLAGVPIRLMVRSAANPYTAAGRRASAASGGKVTGSAGGVLSSAANPLLRAPTRLKQSSPPVNKQGRAPAAAARSVGIARGPPRRRAVARAAMQRGRQTPSARGGRGPPSAARQ